MMHVPSSPQVPRRTPSRYERLSATTKAQLGRLDVRQVRPSELKKVAAELYADRAITLEQKIELDFIRKPYAGEKDDSAFDLVESMEVLAASAGDIEKQIPGTKVVSYYKNMLQVTQWLQQVTKAHPNKVRRFSAWA